MPAVKSALIVGGGIAGLTLAYALQRDGIGARVIEAGKRSDRLGIGISLLGNALRALDRIGLAEPCFAKGIGFDLVVNRGADGTMLNETPMARQFRQDRPAACGILRKVLGDLLEQAAVGAGAAIDFSTTVAKIDQDDDGVKATLSTGEVVEADVLVAADGVYSKIREAVFGAHLKPAYCGTGCWRHTAASSEQVKGITFYRTGSGPVLGAIPISPEHCYYFILENHAVSPYYPPQQMAEIFKERMTQFTAAPVVEAREALGPASIVNYRPFDILMTPGPWHRGRVVLVGDAAHSLTPQLTSGGGMAIEDAVVLAELLAGTSDVRDALEAYSRRRYARVEPIFETTLAICRNEQQPQPDHTVSMHHLQRGYELLAEAF